MLDFIIWDVYPEIFSLGNISPRWYGLLFAAGFLVGQQILIRIYKLEGKSEKHVETLTIYMVLSTIIGARLGHCLFYEPDYFLAHPLEILYVWQGGLASHGATVGILFAIWLYSRKNPGQSYLYVLDRMVITIALAACFIRTGNLMNSEIVGKPTDASYGFVFVNPTTSHLQEVFKGQVNHIKVIENGKDTTVNGTLLAGLDLTMKVKSFGNGAIAEMAENNIRRAIVNSPEYGEHFVLADDSNAIQVGESTRNGTDVTFKAWGVPRHPAQLYEALSSLVLFVLLLLIYNHYRANTPEGLLLGLFVVWIFTLRFLYEFLKENQVAFEDQMQYNMGQLLSIPLILAGAFVLIRSLVLQKKKENSENI
jgi:phosphatidylglycerol:prolipoprotein diacylglycerol transferase